jgi:hypothetical protein
MILAAAFWWMGLAVIACCYWMTRDGRGRHAAPRVR